MLDPYLIRSQFKNLNMFKKVHNDESEDSYIKICNNIAVKANDFINISKNIMSSDWKKRFVELIGTEALLEVVLCFNEYATAPNVIFSTNPNSCTLEYLHSKSPRWVAWRLSQALLNAQFVTFQDTPFVQLLIEVIDHTIGRKLFLTYPTPSTIALLPDTILIASVGSDLDAVIEVIMAEVFVPTSHRYFTLSTILIQDSIYDDFDKKLTLKCKAALEHKKLNSIYDEILTEIVETANKFGAKTKTFADDSTCGAIIYDVKPMHQEKGLPVISLIPFRTAPEALKLAANLNHFCAASIWGTNLTSEFYTKLNTSTIWVNSYGLTHPSITFCPDRYCRFISTKEIGVFYEYDEIKVKTVKFSSPKKVIQDLMLLKEMEPYLKVLQKWLTLDNITVPSNLNVISKIIEPVGVVMIPWSKDGKDFAISLMIPALACGNQVRICVDDEERENAEMFIKPLLSVIPAEVLELGKLGELYGMHPYGNTVDKKSGWRKNIAFYSDSPEKQDILWQFVNCQYIWIEDL